MARGHISVTMKGTFVANARNQIPAMNKGTATRAGKRFADAVLKESNRLVPKDTRFLEGSGYVDGPFTSGDTVYYKVSYSAEYALVVHERMDVHHPNGQAKYLETAMANQEGELPALWASEFRSTFG